MYTSEVINSKKIYLTDVDVFHKANGRIPQFKITGWVYTFDDGTLINNRMPIYLYKENMIDINRVAG